MFHFLVATGLLVAVLFYGAGAISYLNYRWKRAVRLKR